MQILWDGFTYCTGVFPFCLINTIFQHGLLFGSGDSKSLSIAKSFLQLHRFLDGFNLSQWFAYNLYKHNLLAATQVLAGDLKLLITKVFM